MHTRHISIRLVRVQIPCREREREREVRVFKRPSAIPGHWIVPPPDFLFSVVRYGGPSTGQRRYPPPPHFDPLVAIKTVWEQRRRIVARSKAEPRALCPFSSPSRTPDGEFPFPAASVCP